MDPPREIFGSAASLSAEERLENVSPSVRGPLGSRNIQPHPLRLLRTSPPLKLGEYQDNEVSNLKYTILSHRRETEEVSFQEMMEPTDETRQKKGYQKIKHFCERVRGDGFEFAWLDTCCINKESSAELSESINSMFRWYRQAVKCYAYMTDVGSRDQLSNSVWFTRGWTLQELVAPREMVFLASDWSEI
jgi:hypothetical protein